MRSITHAFGGGGIKIPYSSFKTLIFAISALGFLPNKTKIELQLHNKQELLIANCVEFLTKKKISLPSVLDRAFSSLFISFLITQDCFSTLVHLNFAYVLKEKLLCLTFSPLNAFPTILI